MISGKIRNATEKRVRMMRDEPVPDWTERFLLQSKERNKAVCRYEYEAVSEERETVFQIRGEEMAECFCNGEFVGVSFWNPHRFDISTCLYAGKNVIEVRFTGSAANLYEDADIAYGIME